MGFARDSRLESALAFASQLEELLNKKEITPSLNGKLLEQINHLSNVSTATIAPQRVELDGRGTRLWNLARKLDVTAFNVSPSGCLVCTFACTLLDLAQRCQFGSVANAGKAFRVLLKSASLCLGSNQLALAEKNIEKAASYDQTFGLNSVGGREIGNYLSNRYLLLRIALAWRQERLDLARLMLARLKTRPGPLEVATKEELSDLLYEVAKGLMRKSLWGEALDWLTEAQNFLAEQTSEPSNVLTRDLQFCIRCSVVKCLMKFGGGEERAKAWHLLHGLSTVEGEKLTILLLKLELHASDPAPSIQDYHDILAQILDALHLTDRNLKTIMHYLHKLRSWDPVMAHPILLGLLTRLASEDSQIWFEKVLVTILWNCTTHAYFTQPITTLQEVFDNFVHPHGISLSYLAAHAMQVLLWKQIDTAYKQQDFKQAKSWCMLSMHHTMKAAGHANIAKLKRKLILCALGMPDICEARNIAETASGWSRDEPSTQYLLFKLALKLDDADLASKSLKTICSNSQEQTESLYGCMLELQRLGDSKQMLSALHNVLACLDQNATKGLHLPALFRCTARFLTRKAADEHLKDETPIVELCKLFETAASQARQLLLQEKDHSFSIAELDWFSRNTYNLALKFCVVWKPEVILRLLESCESFIELYPEHLNQHIKSDLSLRQSFCSFLSCSLWIVLARREKNAKCQLQYDENVRKAVKTWWKYSRSHLEQLQGPARQDLEGKCGVLLGYDFEAAVRLKKWDDLEVITDKCQTWGDVHTFALLTDIMLSSNAPSNISITVLQRLVNASWRMEGQDVVRLARWTRCLVSLALQSPAKTTEDLIDHVISVLEGVLMEKISREFPTDEIEWLASTLFNHAMDLYNTSRDEDCRRWIVKAIKMSSMCEDEGSLRQLLEDRFRRLTWEEG